MEINTIDPNKTGQGTMTVNTTRRKNMYRMACLTMMVLAIIIYYGLPAVFSITKHEAERILIFTAVPYFIFNAYVSLRWSGTVSEGLMNLRNQRPGMYKLWRILSLGLQTAEKPFLPFTGLFWIILALSGLIWAIVIK